MTPRKRIPIWKHRDWSWPHVIVYVIGCGIILWSLVMVIVQMTRA